MENYLDLLKKHGLRPTKQRLIIAKLLFKGKDKHVTANELYLEIKKNKESISLATIYNVLNDFVKFGLMSKIIVDKDVAYFDTNTSNHYHFYIEDQKKLMDIETNSVHIAKLPKIPSNYKLKNIGIFLTLKNK